MVVGKFSAWPFRRLYVLKLTLVVCGGLVVGRSALEAAELRQTARAETDRPNILLIMTDDQGWGDTSYNGHPVLKTPELDRMAAEGLRFDRFYAAAPFCSPTRGSVMTGRHPYRYGCFAPNWSFRPEEITVAEALKTAGYVTGHFGKWHCGPVKAQSPTAPCRSGFDESLSHDNWFDLDPPLSRNGLEPQVIPGESSEVVAKAALEFIGRSVKSGRPFLSVVWFASPHGPYKAAEEYRQPYKDQPQQAQHFYGEMAAVDCAVGRLRAELDRLGVAENTLVWFCSDNGAVGAGSSGGLRGKKGSLWEGGIRVPGIMVWPQRIRKPAVTDVPCSTCDIYPTLLDIAGVELPKQVEPLDGISLVPLIEGRMEQRPMPLAFWHGRGRSPDEKEPYIDPELQKGWWRTFSNFKHPKPLTGNFPGHAALIDGRYKLHKLADHCELYDLAADPAETRDIAPENAEMVARMKKQLEAWQASVERSLAGQDYEDKR